MKLRRLTAADYVELLRRLQPRGVVWRAIVGSRFDLWIQAAAEELARVHNRMLDVLEAEMFPGTASETLDAWLTALGLGLGDGYDIPATEAEQQDLATSRWLATGGGTPDYYVDVAGDMGFTITITETPYEPFRVGDRVGERLYGASFQFWWRVNASIGLTAGQRAQLEAEINRLKPAHTVVEFVYS